MAYHDLGTTATTGSKPRLVLETVLDEIYFQMDEESVERSPCVCDTGFTFDVPDSVILLVGTRAVTFKETEPVRPVAG